MVEVMVGGAFLSAFLNVLFDRLASQQVVDFFRKKILDENLRTRLNISLMMVNVVLDDAEAKEYTHPAVKQWLEGLKDATYHADDLLDEIVTLASKQKKSSIFKTSFLMKLKQVFSSATYHAKFRFSNKKFDVKRVETIVFKMELLASQKERLGLHERVGNHTSILKGSGRATTSLVDSFVYGRDDDKQKIVESVLMDVAVGDPIPVITIIGMGGIGKTTLAKMVFNDEKVSANFDIKAWICVTEELDVLHITKIVLESITSSHYRDMKDLDLLQLKLKQMLTGKKILLVLDDVWNADYEKWRTLCAPFVTVSSGSKIILTTRNDGVASMMRRTHNNPSHYLKHLSDESGWILFAHHAFKTTTNGESYPHMLEVTGKQIVAKCKGLPLAIKLLGGTLRNEDNVKVWENILKSEFWDLPIGKTGILPALRLSYHFLPTHLKQCFAYCSIFPQDYEFDKKSLVLLWIAEGFVIQKTDKNMEELGEEYFNELFLRSFLQKSNRAHEMYVMPSLNNDLARDVSGEFCLTLERSKKWILSEKVRHFSYSGDNYNDYDEFKTIQNAKYLRTFLPLRKTNRGHSLSISIIRDVLPKLSYMRVLSLSRYTNINELPDSICTLSQLRYLDLSHTSIQSLPDTISQLYNLQTLNLSNCRSLFKLPTNLVKLVNLRHLDISKTSLNKLPPRIRKLQSLQTLDTFVVGVDNSSGLGELNGLQHLKGSLSIMGLHNVKNVEDVIRANLKGKLGIEQLSFEWSRVAEVSHNHRIILDKLQPCVNLKHLTLINYGGTHLSNWLGDGLLSNLTYLKISNCVHCLTLPSLGQLPSLVELHIESMDSVRRVESNFYGDGLSSVKFFQKLVILAFESMPEWEEWSPSRGGDNDDFPKLETLSIQYCPKLYGNSPKILPSLRDLCIEGCSELIAIIPGNVSLRSLMLDGCKNVVFENMSSLNSLISLVLKSVFQSDDSFPNGMMESCTNLERLSISDCPSLTHFPDEGLPITLRTLDISSCGNLKEFLPKETFHNYKHLERLELRNSCASIISFPLGLFPNLKNLKISFLKNLESFSIEDDAQENLILLQDLYLSGCDKFIHFPSGGLPIPNLKSLDISSCKNLKSLPEAMNTQLTSLESLSIHNCKEAGSFPAGGLPSSLSQLSIMDCKKVMAKRRDWDLHTLSFLDALSIRGCGEIVTFPEAEWQLPTSITRLFISNLPNLKTIDASRLLNLQALKVYFCPKVKFNSDLRNAQDLPPSFIEISINKCPLMEKQLETRNTDLIPHVRIDGCIFD